MCSDGGLVLKGLGRAIIPDVIHKRVGSSAGQEWASTPALPVDPDTLESTAL